MQSFARIVSGRVAEPLIEIADDLDIGLFFDPSQHDLVRVIQNGVGEGWTTADGGKSFKAPPPITFPPVARMATGAALIGAMTDDQAKAWQAVVDAGTPAVRAYWNSAYRDLLPEDSTKLVKIAGKAKVDLKALFDAALDETQ